jgi:flagellar hook protein FlgE
MSLYGALFTGVSSLAANSRALGIASNNIANVNTVGYKSSQTQFSTLLASTTAAGTFSSGGVRADAQQLVNRQGLLQISESPTDLALNGQGFFVIAETANQNAASTDLLFTRAGSYTQDAEGYLRNAAGYYLLGWQVDINGDIPTNPNDLTPINLNALTGTATASTTMALRANLRATEAIEPVYAAGDLNAGTVSPDFERTIEVYDSQGGAQPLRIAFVKTAANTWQYEVIYDGDPLNIGGAGNNPIGTGTVTFNPDGTLASPASAAVSVPWSASSGLAAQTVSVAFGTPGAADGVTQFDSTSTLISSNVNGALFGGLSGVRIDEEGYITALFDNGVQQRVYKLPVATFQNPNGLSAITGNAYLRTDDSGNYTLLEAQTGGAGAIASAALEASTVDLAKEFTDLITTQRAYSAGTRIISTADQMLEELIRIKR